MTPPTFHLSRRGFLAASLAAAAPAPSAEPPRRLWIDPKIAALANRPWRKIHLDFHNSEHVALIGAAFDAQAFGDTLEKAAVDAIVVFAKDMHGYFYYPSSFGPVHPGLKFDLLAGQVAACRKRGIAVYAYYCTTWDNYLAEKHPEWLVFKRDRTTYLPKFDETPRWTALCLSHEPFVELMLRHAGEFVSRYELDGAWFDMPMPIAGECFCRACLETLRERGLDPFDRDVQRRHKQELELRFLERMTAAVRKARPGCQVDYNGQAVLGLGARARFQDNIDLEALPTVSQWGYYYFPAVVRYTRTFGLTTYGMTGRFVSSWADFGGLKLPRQLDVELAGIVAQGARCDIGDQMPPNGVLDPAVYEVIGRAYRKIRAIEPWLEDATPVTEAAILLSGPPLDRVNHDATLGLVKLMTEARLQFDIVEPDAGWERYALLVLPEHLAVDGPLSGRIARYVEGGGAVVVSGDAGLLAGERKSWLEPQGMTYAGPSPFKPAYLLPEGDWPGDLPPYEYALYEGAGQWRAGGPARLLARLGEPAFQRSARRYTSHRQSPFDHATGYAAMATNGRYALSAFPLGASYFNHGYWIYRRAFDALRRAVYPSPLLATSAPLNAELTVTRQNPRPGRRPAARWLVHIVNWSPSRGTPRHPVFHEEPVPLRDVEVTLNLPVKAAQARAVVAGRNLPLAASAGAVRFTVPSVPISEIVVLEEEG